MVLKFLTLLTTYRLDIAVTVLHNMALAFSQPFFTLRAIKDFVETHQEQLGFVAEGKSAYSKLLKPFRTRKLGRLDPRVKVAPWALWKQRG